MAIPVVLVMLLSAVSSVAMVGSMLPFLYALTSPETLLGNPYAARLHAWLGGDRPFLLFLGGGVLLMIVVANVLGVARAYVVARYASMRAYGLSQRMLGLQVRQPYTVLSGQTLAVAARRVIVDSNDAVNTFLVPLAEGLAGAISVFVMLVFLAFFNPAATSTLVVFFALMYGLIAATTRARLQLVGKERAAASTQRNHTFNEMMRCIRDVRMSTKEDAFRSRFEGAAKTEAHAFVAFATLSVVPRYIIQSIFFGGIVALCLVLFAVEDKTSATLASLIPTIGIFVFAGQRLIPEVQAVFGAMSKMSYGSSIVHALVANHAEMERLALPLVGEQKPWGLRDSIVFENVGHVYPDRDGQALTSVDLTIPCGQKIGLVGPSGSGKSTLASILMGLIPPSSGRVLVDGRDLGANPAGWRLSVAQVPQDVVLVAGSVRSNIALGEDPGGVDTDRVWAALSAARMAGFVETLPQGLDTDVMTGIASLSGGQRQRLGIARAFYRNADVLVLDEATSALDDATEAAILSEIDAATEGKTVISVAHRLGTLRGCDRIVALDQGRVVFDGDWEAFRAWKARSAS